MQNLSNQGSQIRLGPDLTSGAAGDVLTGDPFQVPTAAARFGRRLAVVNSKMDHGFPPTADHYEVIVVGR